MDAGGRSCYSRWYRRGLSRSGSHQTGEPVSDTIDLQLDDLAYGGDAVGRHEGQVVFVPFGLPGERVRVELEHRAKRYARARLVEVLEPSPQRVAPPCPFYGACGGCQMQHLAYPGQLEHKRRVIDGLLRRIGRQKSPRVLPTTGMTDPFRYRNNVQASIAADGRLGFQAAGTNRVVPISRCQLLLPALDALWTGAASRAAADARPPLARISLRAAQSSGESLVILEGTGRTPPPVTLGSGAQWVYRGPAGPSQALSGPGYLTETLAGRSLRVSADSFFQVNAQQAEVLVERAREYLRLAGHETLLDAYCGVGTFALTVGQGVARVIGIESSSSAIADALANRREGEPVEFLGGAVEDVLPSVDGPCDAAILDPPRAGCTRVALEALAALAPRTIVYVSCDPSTLARDVALLSGRGYRLMEAQPVDMFPQTYHVECVVLMERVWQSVPGSS